MMQKKTKYFLHKLNKNFASFVRVSAFASRILLFTFAFAFAFAFAPQDERRTRACHYTSPRWDTNSR